MEGTSKGRRRPEEKLEAFGFFATGPCSPDSAGGWKCQVAQVDAPVA